MKHFSELTLQRINANGEYYVCGLLDPRNDKLFYIGKGTGDRVFQHVAESGKNPTSEKLKLQTIKNIEDSGNKVQHILINWGLGIRTFHSAFNILPILASTFVTVSLWINNPKLTKIISMPVSLAFLVYDIYVGSYVGIINESIAVLSIVISFFRERK